MIFSFKTSDDLYAIFVGAPIEELPGIRTNIEAHFTRALELAPDFADRLRAGKREERFYGSVDLPNFYRKPYGDGWALVGDAGCHKDPFMALGIADALRDAELLSSAILHGLDGARPMMEGLSEYEHTRNQMSTMDYRQNLSAARFDPVPPEMMRLRQAVRSNPAEATRLSMARAGMIDAREYFSPANLQRLCGSASQAG